MGILSANHLEAVAVSIQAAIFFFSRPRDRLFVKLRVLCRRKRHWIPYPLVSLSSLLVAFALVQNISIQHSHDDQLEETQPSAEISVLIKAWEIDHPN